jgi:hypothetical protein
MHLVNELTLESIWRMLVSFHLNLDDRRSDSQADFAIGVEIGSETRSALVGRLDLYSGWVGWVVWCSLI